MALTRAKNWLYVCCPLRYYHTPPPGVSDRHGYAQRTRFLPDPWRACSTSAWPTATTSEESAVALGCELTSRAVRRRTKDLWR